jgi:hypothetical protein
VLSCERLSGNPLSGAYDREPIAERVRSVFPETSVLLMIREQGSLLRSLYAQYLKIGGACSVERFLEVPFDGKIPHFSWSCLEYDCLIELYYDVFGADRVIVLPYEWLAESPQRLLETLVDRLGTSIGDLDAASIFGHRENAAKDTAVQLTERQLNRYICRSSVSPLLHDSRLVRRVRPSALKLSAKVPPRANDYLDRRIQQRIAELMGRRYEESNRRAGALSRLDLEGLGYPT